MPVAERERYTEADPTHWPIKPNLLGRGLDLLAGRQTVDELLHPFFFGIFLETMDATITSDGATITLSLQKKGGGDLTMVFSDGLAPLDCTPPQILVLTPGGASVPGKSFVYILQSDKILTESTTDWPTAEHIKVAYYVFKDAGYVQTNEPLVQGEINDHVSDQATNLGHLNHIAERIRHEPASYHSGRDATITITPGSPDTVDLALTSGAAYQVHLHALSAFDTSIGDDIHVVNDFTTPYKTVTDIADILTDATGASMSNDYFNLIFWQTVNKEGTRCHLFCNLPTGSYHQEADATADVNAHDVLTIPPAFRLESPSAIMLYRFTFHHSAAGGGDWTLIATKDLRGQTPIVVMGGGTILPQTTFADTSFELFNVADDTKRMDFDLSGVTAATTRTLTPQDKNYMIGDVLAASTIPDNVLVRGDGGARGIQGSAPLLDDSGNITNVTSIGVGDAGLLHDGDTDTGMTFDAGGDVARLQAGGVEMINLSEAPAGQDSLGLGNFGSDVDVNIHSLNVSGLFTVEGATDHVGINGVLSALFGITGRADEVQLHIKGFSTQTSNILLIEQSGGTPLMTLDNAGNLGAVGQISGLALAAANGLTVNSDGGDFDSRIKGLTDDDLIYVDASTDRVGLGTNTPSEKLDVVGNIAVSGTVDGVDVAAHNTRHQSAGADAIKLDDLATPDDNTDLDASTSAHGLLPKLPNDANQYLGGTGVWTTLRGETKRIPILGPGTVPGSAPGVSFEPYSIHSTNGLFKPMVLIFDFTGTLIEVHGSFDIPWDYPASPTSAKIVSIWTTSVTTGDWEQEFGYRAVAGNDTESLDQATFQEEITTGLNDTAPSAVHERMEYKITLTHANFSAGDTVGFVYRRDGVDAGDTIAAAVLVWGLYFEYVN